MKFGRILIALAIALAGCSGDPAPKEPQKTTAPTPKSTATPPVMPAQAKEDSPEGAAAFVSYWVQVSNYAAATGDTAELERISDSACSGCTKYIKLYRETYQSGGSFKGGDWKLGKLQVDYGDQEAYVSTKIKFSAGTFQDSKTGQSVSSKAGTDDISFAVSTESRSRVVTQLGLGGVE